MNAEMLKFSHVAAGYRDREILHDVTLSVEEGDFVGLIGSDEGRDYYLRKRTISVKKP